MNKRPTTVEVSPPAGGVRPSRPITKGQHCGVCCWLVAACLGSYAVLIALAIGKALGL